jgi:serine/threonine protein kinase
MTAVLKTHSPAGSTRSVLAAQLDQLLRHAITVDDFEADVAQACKLDPDDIWVVLALLDQYHRLGKLPTDLFRSLKASADRRGLGRRGLPLPAPQTAAPPDSAPTAPPPAARSAAPANGSVARAVPPTAPPAMPAPSPKAPAAAVHPAVAVLPAAAEAAVVEAAMSAPKPGVGTLLSGRYQLVAALGQDRRGTLYEAIDQQAAETPGDSRQVAVLIFDRTESDAASTLAARRQEFRDAQPLAHPNIVGVRDLGHDGACHFLTMDFVAGESLTTLLARRHHKALPRATALAIIRDLGASLVHAHGHGVVHGDLQPDQVMISTTGEVRVRGFGAVRASSNYASCEQLEDRVADRRDDLFALACIAYELLRGSHPFGLLNAAAARGRGLVPVRPMMLTRTQWQALRIGLAWRRENRTVGVAWWLGQMRLGRAARRLPALDTLADLPPPRRSWLRPLVLLSCLGAALAAAAALDRLPDRPSLLAGMAQLRAAASLGPAMLHRLGDALSPAAPPPAVSAAASPARPVEPVTTTRPSPHSRKLRLAAADTRPRTVAGDPAVPPVAAMSRGDSAQEAAVLPAAAPIADRHQRQPAGRVPEGAPQAVIELASDNYTVLPGESAARIVVHRQGRLQGDVSFAWWTEGASAAAGRDYIDWGRRAEQIPAGRSSITLLVPIVSDATRRGRSRVFYIAIGDAGGGAAVGDTARAAVLMPGGG